MEKMVCTETVVLGYFIKIIDAFIKDNRTRWYFEWNR